MSRDTFMGPAGRLDARRHGTGPPVLALHPHPVFQGSMATRFVYRLCEALADAGFEATRFNFRGVGNSEGSYDQGRGETADARAVWDALAERHGRPPAVVGFSFGAGVAVRLATQRAFPALVLVAPPARVRDSDLRPVDEATDVTCPVHVVVGTDDALVPTADAEAVRAAARGTMTLLEGADHFLTPTHHERGVAAVVRALQDLL